MVMCRGKYYLGPTNVYIFLKLLRISGHSKGFSLMTIFKLKLSKMYDDSRKTLVLVYSR